MTFSFTRLYPALGRGHATVDHAGRVDLLVEGVDVVAELASGVLDLPPDDVRVTAGHCLRLSSGGQLGLRAPGTCCRVSTVRSGFGLTCWNFFLPITNATAPMTPQSDRDDQGGQADVHDVGQRPPEGEGQEHQDHVAGEAGGAEHARALAGLLRLGLDLHLGQLELLAHEGGEVLGDLTDQLRRPRCPRRRDGRPRSSASRGYRCSRPRSSAARAPRSPAAPRRGRAGVGGAHGSAHPTGTAGRVVPAGRGWPAARCCPRAAPCRTAAAAAGRRRRSSSRRWCRCRCWSCPRRCGVSVGVGRRGST